jgi:hypothetical protein
MVVAINHDERIKSLAEIRQLAGAIGELGKSPGRSAQGFIEQPTLSHSRILLEPERLTFVFGFSNFPDQNGAESETAEFDGSFIVSFICFLADLA